MPSAWGLKVEPQLLRTIFYFELEILIREFWLSRVVVVNKKEYNFRCCGHKSLRRHKDIRIIII